MSAALQLPLIWGAASLQPARQDYGWQDCGKKKQPQSVGKQEARTVEKAGAREPAVSVAFYRKHTERMMRRYLYASMQVGRAPSILGDPVARGWVSSRPVRTFEDAVIFVLDIERCLDKLGSLDRQLLSRVVLQEYTQAETAVLMGMSTRAVNYKFPEALDRLTERLLESGLLVLPE
jgi:hypothetical protein